MTALSLSACGGSSSETPSPVDSDNDGVEDTLDAFPNDASETRDSDNDGVGDNADDFPNDGAETVDSDNDGVGDNSDAFPQDENESVDSDQDGVGDNADEFPNDEAESADSDQDGVGDNADDFPNDPNKTVSICNDYQGTTINFAALLTETCTNLSSYNLFADATNPTDGVNGNKSLKYELSMPLFTDYATKYRFVVIPDDLTANYSEKEVMDMPVGTVLIKTFSLPMDTSTRGFANETLIETRLLIHRENGWAALPYRWNDEGTEATYVASGRNFTMSVTHNSEMREFKYVLPSTTDCKECHQLLAKDENGNAIAGSGKFAPIGPKARLLNYPISFSDGETNQLLKWQEKNMLTGVPDNTDDIYVIPTFEDSDSITELSNSDLNELARGYLDVNCAHCHRPTGSANNYGFFLEYDRPLGVETGICKTPVAPPGDSNIQVKVDGTIVDVLPGDADNSFLYERLSTDGSLKMPKIGRSLVHIEGSELIKRWVNALDEDPFNQTCS